ncbi:MAG TPA: glycosyltransferase family 4 protein [Ideonella sp.]|uniref:glycosyltransferase family 4 protein n=1 Tax=Ideonella sp. TaxID=1929293 RepID=UPI002C968A86|nr:glycosyltransferase family 4 protein [Ideonella sp.]HSI50566.1 glycosyltransferase family 4 protein [Ideonella sp.]
MKVLIGMTRSDTTLSGSFTHICQTGEAFRARGAEVVYVLGGQGPANERLRQAGFKVHELPQLHRELRPLRDVLVLLQLMWLLIKERPQVTSWHTAKIGALGRVAAMLTLRRAYYVAHGVPFVNTPQNSGYKLYERLERLLAWLPARIICVCRFDFNEYRRIGVSADKLMTIPNGMNGIDDSGALSDAAGGGRPLRFVTAARFETQKDYATLAAACGQLSDAGLRFELHIFGNGSQETQVRQLMAGLPEGTVHFRGVVDNFAAQLTEHDVFVLCSHWEGLPRSIIEAMACGRPVIASDVGGVSELIESGRNGELIGQGDASAFASAMRRYIEQPALCRAHGENSRRKYQADYTLDVMLSRYCAEYLGAPPPAASPVSQAEQRA